jgi:nicotinate-nucleotide adenylyltransferase
MKIGIMGGTFDPIHTGHLIIGEYARTTLDLDKIIFIPVGLPPHKDNSKVSTSRRRLEMTKLAINSNPYFYLSSIEVDRKEITYTIDTIKELKKIYKEDELYFIIGGDSLFEIEKWKDFAQLIRLCKFVVLERPGRTKEEIEQKKIELKLSYKIQLEKIYSPLIDISSTEIRERVKNNLSIKYLVPESVETYIMYHKLYL